VQRDANNVPLRPLSNESIKKCLALLGRILDDAVERGYLSDNPARRVRRLRHHRPRRPVLEPHEVSAMLDAADRLDVRQTGITDSVAQVAALRAEGRSYQQIAGQLGISLSTAHYRQGRNEHAAEPVSYFRVWVRALCAIGLRIDEACRARRSDVDLVAGCLRVGHAKTPAGVRSVQLTPDTASDLQRYLAMTADRPADGPLLPARRGTFHNRNKHEAGAPPRWIADQGGHSDPSTSLRIYTESLRDRERRQHGAAFDALLNGTRQNGRGETG
jgi:integrase